MLKIIFLLILLSKSSYAVKSCSLPSDDQVSSALAAAKKRAESNKTVFKSEEYQGVFAHPKQDPGSFSQHWLKYRFKPDSGNQNHEWVSALQKSSNGSEGMRRIKMKIEIVDANGKKQIKEVYGSMEGMSPDGSQIKIRPKDDAGNMDAYYLDLNNPKLKVVSVSEVKPSYKGEWGTELNTKFDQHAVIPLYNTNTSNAMDAISDVANVNRIKVKYTGEYTDGYGSPYSTMEGTFVKKDGKSYIKLDKDGKEYPIDEKLGNVEISAVYKKEEFIFDSTRPREMQSKILQEKFEKGTPIQLTGGKREVKGEFLGVLKEPNTSRENDILTIILRNDEGDLIYIPAKEVDQITTDVTEKMLFKTPESAKIKLKSIDED